jgi:intracellular sulfur oxidation DsrE/DsrF family protein
MRILAILFSLSLSLMADEEVKRVVMDLVTADAERFERIVLKGTEAHTTYYGNQLLEYEAVFVIHGGAYKFFLKDLKGTPYEKEAFAKRHEALAKRLEALVENYNVTFEVCSAGLRSRGLPQDKLYPFVKPVFSSASALIDWQDRGHAYVLAK